MTTCVLLVMAYSTHKKSRSLRLEAMNREAFGRMKQKNEVTAWGSQALKGSIMIIEVPVVH